MSGFFFYDVNFVLDSSSIPIRKFVSFSHEDDKLPPQPGDKTKNTYSNKSESVVLTCPFQVVLTSLTRGTFLSEIMAFAMTFTFTKKIYLKIK